MTDYLTVIEVLEIHADQTEAFGGDDGITITAESEAIYRFIIENLEGGTFRYDRIVVWLREHTMPIEAPR